MSDYLWDKTGEPEEDAAQLENLLGALKYKQRPLEIPIAAIPPAATTAATTTARTRPVNIFSRPRLALAASLLLTLLAGAWLFTRQGEEPQKQRQLAEVKQDSPAARRETPDVAVVPDRATKENEAAINVEQSKPREDETAFVAVSVRKPRRTPPRLASKRQKLAPRVEENQPAPREEVAGRGAMRWQVEQPLTPQQREATEQLMLALRLASAKLNYAQREMQEIGRAGR